jgi:hypothetical protein
MIADTVAGIKNGDISASDFPSIRLVERDGNMYTLDNRRLVAFQQVGLAEVPHAMETPEEILNESWKCDLVRTVLGSRQDQGTRRRWHMEPVGGQTNPVTAALAVDSAESLTVFRPCPLGQ